MAYSPATTAGEANCFDYTHARGQDRSLFDGFIFGFVTAKMENRDPSIINSATLKVKELTGAYCLQRPSDSVASAVATFADTIAHFKK
jgi:hypothetical protein